MRKLIDAVWAILLAAQVAEARQDAQAKQGFFNQKVVDFWGNGSLPRTSAPNSGATVSESLFAEPIRLPDGRYTTYVPPRPVLEFLENPTRENARKYVEWQSERLEKMQRAAALLSELGREKSAKAAKSEAMTSLPVTLTYFKKAG